MTARPPATAPLARAHEIAILGNDMVLAALPARPVQLAHAIRSCGFDLVIPVSWGEELLAEQALRALSGLRGQPGVFCSCPRVRARLLQVGSELSPHLLSFVAPPVATARYLRALQPDEAMRITYFGSCEGARDPAIDARVAPRDFLRHLDVSGISIARQPAVYESVVPPDRRRFYSLPGGAPTSDHVAVRLEPYRLLTLGGHDLAAEIADRLVSIDSVLIDVAASLGCACAGAVPGQQMETAREVVVALEPPRSSLPVLEESTLDLVEPTPSVVRYDRPRLVMDTPAAMSGESPSTSPFWSRPKDLVRRRAERRRIAVTPANVQTPLEGALPIQPVREAERAHHVTEAEDRPAADDRLVGSSPPTAATPPTFRVPADQSRPREEPQPPQAADHGEHVLSRSVLPKGDVSSTAVASKSASPWSLARISAPPVARSAWGLLPRAYAGKRRPTPQSVSPHEVSAAGSLVPASGAHVAGNRPLGPDLFAPRGTGAAELPIPAVDSERTGGSATLAGGTGELISPADLASPGAPEAPTPVTPHPPVIAPSLEAVNEYVTVKERMSQRREHSRVRRVPAVHEASSDRLWRMLAYILLIAAIVIATLAIVRP